MNPFHDKSSFPFSVFSLLSNGMIHRAFLAFLSLHHRPNLCSCPIPAISVFPSLENVNALTKPTCQANRKKYININNNYIIILTTKSKAQRSLFVVQFLINNYYNH